MAHLRFLLFPVLLSILPGCRSNPDFSQIMKDIPDEFYSGNFNNVIHLSDSLKNYFPDSIPQIRYADSLAQMTERISRDFSVTEEDIVAQIEKRTGTFSDEDLAGWTRKGWVEWKMINGKKMYFNRSASNLVLLKKFHEQKDERLKEFAKDKDKIFRLKHTKEVYKASRKKSNPVVPVNMKVTYTITVHPDVVPEGETIRCWMPWPKANHARQQNVKLLSVSEKNYIIAPDSTVHSSVYSEKISKKGVPAVFQIIFLYQSNGQYFNMNDQKILPYDKTSYNYKKYTSEQLPQICFTENIKRLADSIAGQEENPAEIVKKIYYWFNENIPWSGALEYSIMPNIPEYVYQYRRGDCGMQTFLLMSMLRYKGIPVRWQSGWMMPPDDKNLHDWCEVYYEGTGWVPIDVSYSLQRSDINAIKDFYISGIDSYRLIVNDGVAGPLYPEKRYMRSEPYDFQRGEVEWKEGNLYFDKWSYDMIIEYIK
ncbi:MAG: transglutaminase-like domain-containing protein [Bacteroidales bacterium]|nr:transglutaminase-like domain-containing protein [Bacteroidales bacterium]